MKQQLGGGLTGIGVLAVLLSLLWPTIMPASSGWTEERATALRELEDKVVDLHYKIEAAKSRGAKAPASKNGTGEMPAIYDKLIAERNDLRAERDGAMKSPGRTSALLRYTGLALAIVGVGLLKLGQPS
jgi:hypothetical protein